MKNSEKTKSMKNKINVPDNMKKYFIYRNPEKYRAFWHLEAVGVLLYQNNISKVEYKSKIWADSESSSWPRSRVAMIDNGVDVEHPYLQGGIRHAIDLSGMPVEPFSDAVTPPDGPFAHLPKIAEEMSSTWNPLDKATLRHFADANSRLVSFNTIEPDSANRLFSMHGTSAAGLVMARMPDEKDQLKDGPPSLVYFGVDPDSELIPVTTSFGQTPGTLILAILYALAKKADVIFIPRSFSDAVLEGTKATTEAPSPGTDHVDPARQDLWRLLRLVLLAASKKVPIVCAAGNDGEGRLVAPAALADENIYPDNGVIAVGAMNYNGLRASYSNYGPGLTLVGPSDDGEMFTRDQARLDVTDRSIDNFPYGENAMRQNIKHIYDYADQDILAIDIAGDFGGISDGGTGKGNTQYGGAFTGFGGTSAASAIVAGVCSLVQRKAKEKNGRRLTGTEMKELLIRTALKKDASLPHLDGNKEMKPDHINDQKLTFEQAFGAGLVNAAAAVDAV